MPRLDRGFDSFLGIDSHSFMDEKGERIQDGKLMTHIMFVVKQLGGKEKKRKKKESTSSLIFKGSKIKELWGIDSF